MSIVAVDIGAIEKLEPEIFVKLYQMLPGDTGFCQGVWNTGACSCCKPQSEKDVLYLLPGELEFLKVHKNMDINPHPTDLMARCGYAEKYNCPCKPFVCRVYPFLPIKCSRNRVEAIDIDRRCAAVGKLGRDVVMTKAATHVNQVIDAVNFLLSVDYRIGLLFKLMFA